MIRSGLTTAAGFLVFLFGLASSASAYRDYFSEAQKAELANIRSVLVEALALTDKGAGNADGIRDVVLRRMGEWGMSRFRSRGPHDVVVRVKCEQRKTWEGTASAAETMTCWMPRLAYGRASLSGDVCVGKSQGKVAKGGPYGV